MPEQPRANFVTVIISVQRKKLSYYADVLFSEF